MGKHFDYEEGEVIATSESARFLVKQKLGAGGMGACYLVEEVDFPRPYVLKTMNAKYSDREDLKKALLEEGRVLAKLFGQDNIVQAFRAGKTDRGLPYYLMEVLSGKSLRQVLKERKALDIDAACGIASDIAHGLEHAHHHQVIHRDMKPENVVLHRTKGVSVAKIIDFGVFKGIAAKAGFTEAVGTPAYMAPEQLKNAEVAPGTDLFALGLMLYEMIVGVHPFSTYGLDVQGALRRMSAKPRSLASMGIQAPKEILDALDEIIAGCCEPDIDKRWRDATALEAKLAKVKRLVRQRGHSASPHEAVTAPGDVPPEVMAQITGIVDEAALAPATDPDVAAVISPRGEMMSGFGSTLPEAGRGLGGVTEPAPMVRIATPAPKRPLETKPPSIPLPAPASDLSYKKDENGITSSRAISFIVLLPNTAPEAIRAKSFPVTFGREDATITIAHPTVSKSHAMVTLEGDKLFLRDEGSSNGTYVQRRRLKKGARVEIGHGTVFELGDVDVEVFIGKDPVSSHATRARRRPPDVLFWLALLAILAPLTYFLTLWRSSPPKPNALPASASANVPDGVNLPSSR